MSHTPVNVGVIGCGNISGIYLEAGKKFDILNIVGCADLDLERARAQAAKYDVPWAGSVEDLLANPEVELIINLTVPQAHASIALAAVQAGKHIYNEKPLTIERAEARQLLELAEARGLRVGCAPDTFLGGGLQTCRKLIDEGAIGTPVGATAFMMSRGVERWHPNPNFYYQPGAGPMFDMGPYYLTALIHLLGPVRAVVGAAGRLRSDRVIGSGPRTGERIPVEVDTHVSGVLEHANGALSTITTSFDGVTTTAAPIEVHGETGTLAVPDPNHFDGETRLFPLGGTEWRTLPASAGYTGAGRGVGLLDLVTAEGRSPRASGELALHVLEIMTAVLRSADEGRRIELTTTVERPVPVPLSPWTSAT